MKTRSAVKCWGMPVQTFHRAAAIPAMVEGTASCYTKPQKPFRGSAAGRKVARHVPTNARSNVIAKPQTVAVAYAEPSVVRIWVGNAAACNVRR